MEATGRNPALDVLRGVTVALMILVNTPGSWNHVLPPLRHASWHGCTLADLVFPFFLFVMGVSLFFSLSRQADRPAKSVLIKVGKRIAVIFLLGLFLNTYPQWLAENSQIRIMGVLQRIALAYGLAALLILYGNRRWLPAGGAFVLLACWGILYFCGGADPYSLAQNAAIPVDSFLLGESHLYRGFGIPFDPEGLFGTLPAAVTVLAGYLAGGLIPASEGHGGTIKLAAWGAALTAAGLLWSLILPLNKPLWTGSYVLYTAGIAFLVLACLIYLIDGRRPQKWTILFSVFGCNPLFLFVLSIVWGKTLRLLVRLPTGDGQSINAGAWLYSQLFVPLAGPAGGSFLFALAHVALFGFVGSLLYRHRIFIKV